MAEGVHQVVQGNYDRAGPALDTYSKGKFPADRPMSCSTPRSGTTLTHRVALHLQTGLDPADPALTSPRAKAEPAVDALLKDLLPDAGRIAAVAVVTDPRAGTENRINVTAADLKLSPLDLVALVDPDNDRSGRVLDDLIEGFVIASTAPRPDATLAIIYRERIPAIPGHVPFFELAALTRPLRDLVMRSRPLKPTDMTLSADATDGDDGDVAIALPRITLPRDMLTARRVALDAFRAPLQARIDAERERPAHRRDGGPHRDIRRTDARSCAFRRARKRHKRPLPRSPPHHLVHACQASGDGRALEREACRF